MSAIQSIPNTNKHAWLQSTVRNLGSYAQSSTPSYTLAALFALSTPFGFASPAQAAAEAAAKLQRQQAFSQASADASSRGSSSLVARIVAFQRAASASASSAPVRTLPPFWQLAFFAAAFGTGGYIIDQGDALNGSGVVTAWSLTYLLFKTAPSIKQLPSNPLAAALSTAVLTIGLGVHASHYFDRTSWRGAVPTLAGNESQDGKGARSKLVSFDRVGSTGALGTPTSIFAGRTTPVVSSDTGRETETGVSEIVATRGPTRNNDEARAAAYLQRQEQSASAGVIV
ncbi:uncharacterized protein UBRO_04777 [Ustilago bromivora]|uniref:Uncharacterized protein n=1 Tax=Ustilago bromivora TaxID=307758 RepID=A0A1K0H767_9BASI|nr:uncharacterized protein UBRO_04777 [Ustilago bromivora]SYW81066.1 uncharacterized protein UBRO2_04098 [Ustilago bromivora]